MKQGCSSKKSSEKWAKAILQIESEPLMDQRSRFDLEKHYLSVFCGKEKGIFFLKLLSSSSF